MFLKKIGPRMKWFRAEYTRPTRETNAYGVRSITLTLRTPEEEPLQQSARYRGRPLQDLFTLRLTASDIEALQADLDWLKGRDE